MTSPRIAATALNICESGPRRSDGRSLGIRGVDVGPEKRRPWRRRLWRRRLWRDGRLRITAARAALRRLETKVRVRLAKAFTADDLTHTKGVVCRVCTIIEHWRMLRLRIMGVADVGGHLAPTPNTAFDGRLPNVPQPKDRLSCGATDCDNAVRSLADWIKTKTTKVIFNL